MLSRTCEAVSCHADCLASGHDEGQCRGGTCLCLDGESPAGCLSHADCPGGEVRLDGDVECHLAQRSDCGPIFYRCLQSGCQTYECETPLVLQFEVARPVAFAPYEACGRFDLSAKGDGSATATDWPTAASPWLALDRDGDGAITSGRELFGSATPVAGGTAKHGFQALAELDAGGDGAITPADPLFARLLLWADLDGDRVSSPQELQPLAARGVYRLELDYAVAPRCDGRGNCERERAAFSWIDADGGLREGAVIDVHLAVRETPVAVSPVTHP